MAMLCRKAIEDLGFAFVGENAQISDRTSFYGVSRITRENNIRIDDFCVFAAGPGGILIGNYVHIAVASAVIEAGKITVSDFSGLSSRISICSSSGNYSGTTLTNPTVPGEYPGETHADVFMGKHVIVGSGCGRGILPGVTLEEGVAIGALSLVHRDCEAFGIYVGNSARRPRGRKRNFLKLERRFIASKMK